MHVTRCRLMLHENLFYATREIGRLYETGRYLHNYGLTYALADNRYRVKMEPSGRNTPTFGRAKELAVGSTFEFAIVSESEQRVPRWIRLGKWMSKASVHVAEQLTVKTTSIGVFTCTWPVNPLDLHQETKLLAYDMISMPPVSLLDHVQLSGSYLRLSDGSNIPAGLAYRFPKG